VRIHKLVRFVAAPLSTINSYDQADHHPVHQHRLGKLSNPIYVDIDAAAAAAAADYLRDPKSF